MNIYVDFDDCLCETARYFCKIAREMFGKNVPYEKVMFFNLQESFSLNDEEYERLMEEGHKSEVLRAFEETPGASAALNSWIDAGHNVFVITGRPYSAYEASRAWLDEHGLERVKLFCLNKYGRENFMKNSTFSLEIDDYYKMHFDYAVEDSPAAFKFFKHLPDLKVLVYDRPWNRGAQFPCDNFSRQSDWEKIRRIVEDD
ncbi:MAG: 2-dehydropantoate 2-reductase [Lachnospiraceae bacterium]|nr:2-dehydropantoate 2-reductase [Lachnospiraceae bacterium]